MDFRAAIDQEEAPPPAVMPPMSVPADLSSIKKELGQYDGPLAQMEEEAKALVIQTEDDNSRAVAIGGGAKGLHKNLKRSLDTLAAPANDYLKSIRNLFKAYLDRLESVEANMKQKVTTWQHNVRMEQQRREAAAREEARKLQEKIDAEAKALREEAIRKAEEAAKKLKKEKDADARAALEKTIAEETEASHAATPQVAAVLIEEAPKVTRTETGSGHLRMEWAFEVTDLALVDRKYLVLDEKAIRADVRAGLRESPGFRIFEKPITVFRT